MAIDTGTASFSIAAMILAYIPGHQLYFQIAVLIEAKLYSNSMIAALNSRMRVVSNSTYGLPPSWNESVNSMELLHVRYTQDLAFRRDESTDTVEDVI